jgi:2,4-didehydro-3-deoxy-L-rhamnonate hydrolase
VKLCWFDDRRLGLVSGARVLDITEVLGRISDPGYPARKGDLLIANLAALAPAIAQAAGRAASVAITEARFLSPVAQPTKIIGTPVNYLKHVEEAQAQIEVFTQRYQGGVREQGMFLKAVSALVGPAEGVTLRFPERRNDHEMELGVVIGRKASQVSVAEALSCVAGYSIALDMVVRGPEDRSFRKSIDSYAVLGPWLVTADEIPNPGELGFRLSVNGELRQASNTRFMILNIAEQIAWASQFYTLWPGDIIMTGTCEGVGPVRPGDVMHCEIDGIGAMDVGVS